jgi:hypothetical protein
MASQSVAGSKSMAAFIPDLERLAAEAMDERKVPGLALAVVQNGEVALVRAYGHRNGNTASLAPLEPLVKDVALPALQPAIARTRQPLFSKSPRGFWWSSISARTGGSG